MDTLQLMERWMGDVEWCRWIPGRGIFVGLEPEPNLGRLGGNLYILKHQFTTTHVRTNSFSGRDLKSEMSIDVILDSLVVIVSVCMQLQIRSTYQFTTPHVRLIASVGTGLKKKWL